MFSVVNTTFLIAVIFPNRQQNISLPAGLILWKTPQSPLGSMAQSALPAMLLRLTRDTRIFGECSRHTKKVHFQGKSWFLYLFFFPPELYGCPCDVLLFFSSPSSGALGINTLVNQYLKIFLPRVNPKGGTPASRPGAADT